MNEWRAVIGYEGHYEVSGSGAVRRIGRGHGVRAGKLVSQRLSRAGYWQVRLTKGSKSRTYFVHRLVAAAFIGPCPNGMEVNHKDRDRRNAGAENLEYVTRGDNMRHSYANGAISVKGAAKWNAKLSEDDIREIRSSTETSRSIGLRKGICHKHVLSIRKRQKWAHVI